MRLLLVILPVIVGLWAADKLAYDGYYEMKIWKAGNRIGHDYQTAARAWVKQHL
jgi:hypothetical protein